MAMFVKRFNKVMKQQPWVADNFKKAYPKKVKPPMCESSSSDDKESISGRKGHFKNACLLNKKDKKRFKKKKKGLI